LQAPVSSSPSKLQMDTAGTLKEITASLGIPLFQKQL